MTQAEFLDALAKYTQEKRVTWKLVYEGHIRTYDGGKLHCPLSFVNSCFGRNPTGRYSLAGAVSEASKWLKLRRTTGCNIMGAADDRMGGGPMSRRELRKKILKACGLS